MKNKLRQPKVIILISLLVLISIPGFVFAINSVNEGYRIYQESVYNEITAPSGYYNGNPVLPICKIVENAGTNDYFAPTKTPEEWNAFIANKPADITLHDCCDREEYGINGVYSQAAYFKDSPCGSCYGCMINAQEKKDTGCEPGNLCGFNRRYDIQCSTMFKAHVMCHGDPCITGYRWRTNKNEVRFCYGTYDAVLNRCIYEGSTVQTIDGSGHTRYEASLGDCSGLYGNCYSYPSPPYAACCNKEGLGTESEGVCSYNVPCDDGYCSTQHGESCYTCSADCGTCACSYYDSMGEYTCESRGCYWHNYGDVCSDTDCEDYDDDLDCSDDGCYWDYNSGVCSDGECPDYSNPFECEDEGCYYHFYGNVCSDTDCNDYYYEYDCSGDGCYWDEYSYPPCSSGGYY